MSSSTAATARSVSTIRNDSACSLAGMMLMPRLRAALASVSCLMLVVPDVDATDLPLRSSIPPSLLHFLEMKRVAVRKCVLVKDLLEALGIVGGRAAFEIDGAVRKQGNAGRGRHRVEFGGEFIELELFLHGLDDLQADIDGEADRLLVVVQIREGDRGIAVTDIDDSGFLDLLERACEFLRVGVGGENKRAERDTYQTQAIHSHLLEL